MHGLVISIYHVADNLNNSVVKPEMSFLGKHFNFIPLAYQCAACSLVIHKLFILFPGSLIILTLF